MRSFCSVFSLLFISCLTLAGSSCAADAHAAPGAALASVSAILKSDGSLDHSKGLAGGFDVTGYRMVTDASGAPRFVPATAGEEANVRASMAAASSPSGPPSDADEDDVYWDDQFPTPGPSGLVYAIAADAAGNVYVGGEFTAIGSIQANHIARWNGSSWSALGCGVDGRVAALAVSGSNVYAGGYFSTAGGVAVNHIARWNGSSWSALGSGTDGTVCSLAVGGNDVYAGGAFASAGGVPASQIACWDGTSWSSLGRGVNGTVNALAVGGSYVYAGGSFTKAGGRAAKYVARWNGRSWSALGRGTDGPVAALAVSGRDVYAGGSFRAAGAWNVYNIAKWNGRSWSWMGGMDGYVYALAVSGNDVYAGGAFTYAGGVRAVRIAKWNGASWSAMDSGVDNYPEVSFVYALAASGNQVYAGGDFTTAGGLAANHIGRWNGISWSALCGGVNGDVHALAVNGSEVYAGGSFTTAGGLAANHIGRWNGMSWSALGSGLDDDVYALAVSGSDVYAGGDFATASGVTVNHVARWNGTSWSAMGSGMDGAVAALAVSGGDVYAGGTFTTAGGATVNHVARWDGTSWSPMGSGVGGYVYALAVNGNDVYVGGSFTTAGGVTANYVARWDGTSWSPMGSGVGSYVYALAVSGNDVYVGGSFTTVGGVPTGNLARWNGTSWWAMPGYYPDVERYSRVTTLSVIGKDVYAGWSLFYRVPANPEPLELIRYGIVKWGGTSWGALGGGMDFETNALAASGNTLWAGGGFSTVGEKVSYHLAEWQPRVDVARATVSSSPGGLTVGDSPCGFNRPALMTQAGTTVDYSGALPTTVTLDRADEILVDGKRINSAFTLSPEGLQFGGAGATLRVEFSDIDVAAHPRATYADFRAVKLTYPSDYPSNKEAADQTLLAGQSAPAPIRVDNGKQIYAITVPISEIGSTYGAVFIAP